MPNTLPTFNGLTEAQSRAKYKPNCPNCRWTTVAGLIRCLACGAIAIAMARELETLKPEITETCGHWPWDYEIVVEDGSRGVAACSECVVSYLFRYSGRGRLIVERARRF